MTDPTVLLRLSGTGPDDRLRAWVEALGRVPGRRVLHLPDLPVPPPGLAEWCADAGVDLAEPSLEPAGVLVLGAARDLPTPGALRRLVAATSTTGRAHETRVLPLGTSAADADGAPVPPPVACVALPATTPPGVRAGSDAAESVAAARAAGIDARRLDTAAVFVDRRGEAPPTVVPGHADPPPYGHPAALPATALHQLLLRTGITPPALPQDREARPFLTVITRTQGTRLLLLEEVLTCLAGQTSRDFELVLACHRVVPDDLAAVRDVVAAQPAWLRERTRVLEVARPGRASPLNDALDVARGRYAVVLDDDDAVTTHWVAAFAEAESRGPGTVLRSVALAQDVRPEVVEADLGPAPVEDVAPRSVWPTEFDLVDHLWDNASPFMTVAFPRGVFDDLGLRFDETLNATEDWEYLLRAAGLTGVTSSPAVTSVYRTWTGREGSRQLHDEDVWAVARRAVLDRVDEQVLLLPRGGARRIRDLHRALLDETAEKFRFAGLNEQAAEDLVAVNEAVVALRARIVDLEERLARQRRRRQGG